MSHRAGNALVFILGITMVPCAQADVLNYARDWTQREEENKSVAQPQAQEEKRPASRPTSETQQKSPAKQNIKVRPSTAGKTITVPAKSRTAEVKAKKTPALPLNDPQKDACVMTGEGINNEGKSEVYFPNERTLGRWLKSLIQHIAATPSEKEVKALYLVQKEEMKRISENLVNNEREIVGLRNAEKERLSLFKRVEQLEERNAQWQLLTQKMQKNLKEAQYPPLPTSGPELEDFAAGMAMGFDIIELLEQRSEQGVQVDRTLFLAGITETLRGERRLSQEDFEQYLNGANQRVANAVQKALKDKEVRDREWLQNFIKQEGTLAADKEAWFRVIHSGEALLPDNELVTELTISFTRRLTDGTLIADTDISGLVLQEKFTNLPYWLQIVVEKTRLNGEAELAVKVNEYGDPSENGSYVEHWSIRVVNQQLM
ncbi:FKBP-type peptidyl-prolyl cis-trans isomerase N-terminal domain-containing protein [Klebsiella michiganensis]|uniref:FKBP-type peptidyl-prolyl cis-trans isomerase N-terminal domain-containing protein n=2 Tax=Klebsiella michiganensis TaxID=1134687 RepID=UPI0015981DFD|nr:FKBP-type peptidyl-prolyl cis-trans isomerase N-terminal domain-containing protein [Klebsiella michiganensis]ELS0725310.1 FKBP-type peptidyl-prolyl cis-trans isomerase N-terminal domain-containing protein [Klebsiella michiganensis]MDG9770299.1 FKBP-type peptidyl-prolyl cis-trans isomerase N-terminal domain-containing protein [Klebsiella michiganensis]MDH0946955.1 FKBP-type peptidyl-prolyl cis-trans isomerase N-terminal domain-containing protein [Klebsiella michiganensis]MDH1031118.1 FKBP-typ